MQQMKRYIYLALLSGSMLACNKDFLQRDPITEIGTGAFFNTPQDLETYTNSLYKDQLTYSTDDINSDNISSYSGDGEMDLLVRGTINSNTVKGWDDFNKLRRINFMLENVGKTQGDAAAIKHYIGIARFFRAWFYYKKIARYSDVPWYSRSLNSDDQELYKAADPRKAVADSVLNDLIYAVENIKPDEGNRTRVSKWSALALMSRYCLFEGTFRKYHPEVELTGDYKRFLDKAVWASEQVMNSGRFSIYNTGKGGEDYRALFASSTLNGNKEMIQWLDFQQSLGIGNNTHSVLGWTWSLSRSLAESYLMKDGTPFTAQPGYDKLTFVQMMKDRDPRLAETIAPPGFSPDMNDKFYLAKPNLGGLDQVKFYPRMPAQRKGWDANYTGLPVFRYAEVLLNYVEAKAEGGAVSQDDVNKTINLLRQRVMMPMLDMGQANAAKDPVLALDYKLGEGGNDGLRLEIRRERRVELACEGFRFEDLNRWAAGNLFEKAQQGMYVPALGALDISGDGKADIAILASPNDESPLNGMPESERNALSKFYLKDKDGKNNNFYLTNGNSGFIAFARDRDQPRTFIAPKYYYRPIPMEQLVLNKNLQQPKDWR
ncbi:RagB/SusD family nutrient uptake outer membrane protein [Chitinophaga pendula]|uniref:RagB/SusD family nutrient uptake outer membrane protein n=1 Tax=Chitinophaga TaxID=79328 RepID=UPI000BB04853|nr:MULTISPECIES: RagB/SusD family nutrient uptake outer membrane protein [Chitinophaga]ASZ15125.1 RagB/SusD family nutrient uptake outer membrane protein [Chitinophaga sp. MD30]UCJ08124.1 RagB/SusD family nutrient uptake outer membrane protein [Chitinophaga pendula]